MHYMDVIFVFYSLLLFFCCFLLPLCVLFVSGLCFFIIILSVLSSFATILMRKNEAVALFLLSS